MKKMLSVVLAFTMVFCMMIPVLAASPGKYTDIPDDWSEAGVTAAISNGLLLGSGGRVYPEAALKRSEMAAILNRAFGAALKGDISKYSDIPTGKWYADEMAKAVRMGTFQGNGNKMTPEAEITRQEAFGVLARAFKLTTSDYSVLDKYSDKASVDNWAKPGISALLAAGYISGNNNRLSPLDKITRAEIAQVMHNIVKNYIRSAGTYTSLADGNVIITAPDVTLKGVTVKGDLIIGDGVGTGNVTLDAVKIEGRTVVRGGGKNSIHVINGSTITGTVIVDNVNNQVRIVTDNGTVVERIEAGSQVILEGSFGEVRVVGDSTAQANGDISVEVKGIVHTLTVETKAEVIVTEEAKVDTVTVAQSASGSILDVMGTAGDLNIGARSEVTVSGTVAQVEIARSGEDTSINTAEGARIDTVVANAPANISGAGTVSNVDANANDVKVDTAGTTVKAGEGTTGVTAGGNTVAGGSQTTTAPPSAPPIVPAAPAVGGGDGGGGGENLSIAMEDIEPQIFQAGAEKVIPVSCDPADAAITVASSDEAVAAVSVMSNDAHGGPPYCIVITSGTKVGYTTITYTASKNGYTSTTKTFGMTTTPGLPDRFKVSTANIDGLHIFVSDFNDAYGNRIKWDKDDPRIFDKLNYYGIDKNNSKVCFTSNAGEASSVSATLAQLDGYIKAGVNNRYSAVTNGFSLHFTAGQMAVISTGAGLDGLFAGYDPAVHTQVFVELKGAMYDDPACAWDISASPAAAAPGAPLIEFSTDADKAIGDQIFPVDLEKVIAVYSTPADSTIAVTSSDEDVASVYVWDNVSDNVPLAECETIIAIDSGMELGSAVITVTASKDGYQSSSISFNMTTIAGLPNSFAAAVTTGSGLSLSMDGFADIEGNPITWDELNTYGINTDESMIYFTAEPDEASGVCATLSQLQTYFATTGPSIIFSEDDMTAISSGNGLNGMFAGFDPEVHKYIFIDLKGTMWGDADNPRCCWEIKKSIAMP